MSMTLWPRRAERDTLLEDAEIILRQKLWLPIYEQGGLDALIRAREVALPPPAPTGGQESMSSEIRS